MSDLPEEPAAPEENFFTHLVELRDRIIKASISVIVLFLGWCIGPLTFFNC